MTNPDPLGITFFDARAQRQLLFVRQPGHKLHGWLCYHSASADRWVALRLATGRDLLAIQTAEENKTMSNDEPLPRTPAETVARMLELAEGPVDLHGVERSRLLEALPFEDAQQFLREDAEHTAEGWEVERTKSRESVIAQIVGHLGFAWTKANECRVTSMQKMLSHFKGLLWLLGPENDDLREWIRSPDAKRFYGKPALVKISELVSFAWRHPGGPDNDEWTDTKGGDYVTADEALGRE